MNKKTIKSKQNHHQIHQQVDYIKKIFNEADVKINESSFLFLLLKDVKENFSEYNNPLTLFNALHVDRIATSLPCLENTTNKKKYLLDLLKGTLDFMEHKSSHAKSILWELDILTYIKPAFENAYLDEPDIVIPFLDGDIGISCKKITSEKNLQSVLSKAVSQVEKNAFEFGIVAINIDDLLPERKILQKKTHTEVMDFLHMVNMNFLNRNEHRFLKYFKKSRIIAVLVSTSIIADIENAKPQFNNTFQWTIWTIPDLNKRHKEKMQKFKRIIQ